MRVRSIAALDDVPPEQLQARRARVVPRHSIPLIVDLDGTLVRTDTLHESLLVLAFRRPWHLVGAVAAMRRGRAVFKRQVGRVSVLDCAALPFDPHVLDLIERRRGAGDPVHLVTAADQSIADGVASALKLFDTATGSDGSHNLRGSAKAAYLAERFPDGFDYVGDCASDIAVWRETGRATLAGGSKRLAMRLEREGLTTTVLPCHRARASDWVALVRSRRWLANLLLFLPLLTAPEDGRADLLLRIGIAWLLFGMAGSAANMLGELSDLAWERRHPTRRSGPLAAGRIGIGTALALSFVLLAAALAGAALLGGTIVFALLSYAALVMACHPRPGRTFAGLLGAAGMAAILLAAGLMLAGHPLV